MSQVDLRTQFARDDVTISFLSPAERGEPNPRDDSLDQQAIRDVSRVSRSSLETGTGSSFKSYEYEVSKLNKILIIDR